MIAVDLGDAAALSSVVVTVVATAFALRANVHSKRSADASQRAADAADRSAAAEELQARIEAERHQRDLDDRERNRLAAEHNGRAASLRLQTARQQITPATFGHDGIEHFLEVFNDGQHKASNIAIANLTCNGVGDHDFAPTASPADLRPREALLPGRGWRIPLISSGERNQWDVYECTVSWEDGNGAHQERLRVQRGW